MLEAALKWLETKVLDGSKVQKLDSKHPDVERFVIAGEIVERDVPALPRSHQFDDLDDLCQFIDGFPLSDSDDHRVVIWYDMTSIRACLDNDSQRNNFAALKITPTEHWNEIVALGGWVDQKEFIRLLRFKLRDVIPPAVLLDKVRKIKFENGVTTSQENRRDRESMGREITSRLTAEAELPEEFLVPVTVAKVPGLETAECLIELMLEVDPSRGAFRLQPAPGQIDAVTRIFLSNIGQQLHENLPHIPVYNGRPE